MKEYTLKTFDWDGVDAAAVSGPPTYTMNARAPFDTFLTQVIEKEVGKYTKEQLEPHVKSELVRYVLVTDSSGEKVHQLQYVDKPGQGAFTAWVLDMTYLVGEDPEICLV